MSSLLEGVDLGRKQIPQAASDGNSRRRLGESVVVLPHLNGTLLGDKVVLSAVSEWLARVRPPIGVIGIEGDEALSMASYRHPPDELRRGAVAWELETIARRLRSRSKWTVLLLEDHNSRSWSCEGMRPQHVRRIEMWTCLGRLAQEGVFPRLQPDDSGAVMSGARLTRVFGGVPSRYVTLHVRQLRREPWKNGNEALVRAVAPALVKEVGCAVVLVGRADRYEPIRAEGVADLRGIDMGVAELRGLLGRAALHIGGDSGPMHVAGAVGTRLCCLDYITTRFGPFVRPGQIAARFGPRRKEGILELEDWRQIVEVVARSVPAPDELRTRMSQKAHENAA